MIKKSSSGLQQPFFNSGFRQLFQCSLHCFPFLPWINRPQASQSLGPFNLNDDADVKTGWDFVHDYDITPHECYKDTFTSTYKVIETV